MDQFKQTMKNYEEMNEERQRLFYELKEKDEKSAKEIDTQMKRIQELTVSFRAIINILLVNILT